MVKQIFVNLPVKNLKKTIDFFTQIGFKFNQQFSNENGTCMIVGENIFFMLLVEKFFKTFTKKEICDSTKSTEAIFALSVESRKVVDEMVKKAVAAGGITPREPVDNGFMYQHGFEDLDGHIWEIFFMEPSHIKK